MKPLRILVVEDNPIIAEDICDCLKESNHVIVGPCFNLTSAKNLIAASDIEMALLDIHLEQKDDGIKLAAWLKERIPVPVIFLTAFSDETTLLQVKKTHPAHYLVKPFTSPQLKAAIEITAANFYEPNMQQSIHTKIMKLNQSIPDSFTLRETEIIALLCQGLTNREMATELFISENTLKTHLKNIFIKANVNHRSALIQKFL